MRPLLRPTEMAAADRAAITAGTPGTVLMERAGRAVARAVIELAGGRYGKKVLVVCGKGNNGGDGFVAARALAAQGLSVTCAGLFDPSDIGGDAAHHLDLMQRAGIPLSGREALRSPSHYDVVVDAIFGTGFKGPAEGLAAEAIAAIGDHPAVVSVDIPSGVDGATGAVDGPAVHADVTVTFGAEKTGTAVPPGSIHAGVVEVVDIGIDVSLRKFETSGEGVIVDAFIEMAEAADVAQSLPVRPPNAHKRSTGSVLVLAGSPAYTGAASLTVLGAWRTGAGYVTLGSPGPVVDQAVQSCPELVGRSIEGWGPGAIEALKPDIERAGAVAIGPGMGSDGVRAAVEAILSLALPTVVDADALNALAEDPSALSDPPGPVVLTPHPAELARLLQVETETVVKDRLGAALEASGRFPRCIVLLKGHRTVVSYGSGKVAVVIPVGGPELATAGSGDVLAGVVATLLAQRVPPVGAAIAGAYLHGLAGSVAGQRLGGTGVMATDVAEALPDAIDLLRALPLDD